MCQICNELHETIKIKYPYQYYRIIDQIKTMMQEGILFLIEGNYDIYQIEGSEEWVNDFLYHIFKCVGCDQKFSLNVETYHGNGGSWKVLND